MGSLAWDSEGGREGQIKGPPSVRALSLVRLGVGAPSPLARRWRDWKELRAINRLRASGAPTEPMNEFEDGFLLRPGRIAAKTQPRAEHPPGRRHELHQTHRALG